MLRLTIVIGTTFLITTVASSLSADTGQAIIYKQNKPEQQTVTPPSQPHQDEKTSIDQVPQPFDSNVLGNFSAEGRAIRIYDNITQRAVVAWNGKEEILILSLQQKSLLPKDGAIVSFLPLPGKPLEIKEGEHKTFNNFRNKIYELANKQHGWVGGRGPEILFKKEIGSHHLIAIEIKDKNVNKFYVDLQNYVTEHFGDGTAAMLGEKEKKVFEYYINDLQFRYFVIDIQTAKANNKTNDKEAIVYRFESKSLFFPLVISRLGGTGETQVQLVAVTPNQPLKLKGIQSESVGNHTPPVTMTADELRKIDQDIAKLMSGASTSDYKARVWIIDGQIDKFEKDLVVE